MTNKYFQFPVRAEMVETFFGIIRNNLFSIYDCFENDMNTEFWESITFQNLFIYSSVWKDEKKREELLSLPEYQTSWTKILECLERQPEIYVTERILLEQSLTELPTILPPPSKPYEKKVIQLDVNADKINDFLLLCNSHVSCLNQYKDNLYFALNKNTMKDEQYYITYIWKNEESELNYYNSHDFLLFWKVINSILKVSPVSMNSKRIYFENTHFGK